MPVVSLTSTRPSIDVEIDGKIKKLPLRANRVEITQLGAQVSQAKDANVQSLEWFGAFAKKYLGDAVDKCGDDEFMMLFDAWVGARKELGEPELKNLQASQS